MDILATNGDITQMNDSSRSSIVNNILRDGGSQGKASEEVEQMCKEVAATAYLGTWRRQLPTFGKTTHSCSFY